MADPKVTLYGAIAANVAIAVTKCIVAGITGSSAMLSEGVHSFVDTGNGVLLLVGRRLSQRPPTPEHPFGHGKELFFWSLIVAVLIFGLGGGISFYQGVLHVRDPRPLEDPFWNYAVLAEDAAALIGLAVAALSIWASHRFNAPALDGVGSIVIGVLLAGVAVVLIHESRGLLVGEGIRRDTAQGIREIVRNEPAVREVGALLSMYIGPDEVLLAFDVAFREDTPADEVAATVERIEQAIRARHDKIRRIYIEGRHSVPTPAGAPR